MTNLIKFEDPKIENLRSFARMAAESKQYGQLTEASLLNLMLTAKDMGISPMKAINGAFHVVNGRVCMSTVLMADRIRKAGHSIKIIEMTSKQCVIIAQRKDNGDSLKFEYTMQDADTAGLLGSPTWKKYPKTMLYNRAMSGVARILFPDVIGNCYSEEERFDIQDIAAEERPLEDPEEDITIEMEAQDKQVALTKEQCAELEMYLKEDPEVLPKILAKHNISDVKDLAPEKFLAAINFLRNRKEERSRAIA